MTRKDYEAAIIREVEEWPGVTLSFEEAGTHPRAILTFGDKSKFTPYPSTPSDHRGPITTIAIGIEEEFGLNLSDGTVEAWVTCGHIVDSVQRLLALADVLRGERV